MSSQYVSITFFEDPSVTDNLKIMKKISQGKLKVYKVYSEIEKQLYALKLFPNDTHGNTQYKKEAIISDLSHPNIIKYIPASVGFQNDSDFHCILTEYAKYGDLFDMVKGGLFTSEIIVRTYFHQLVAGLEHMHSQGVAHLDLKLENIMVGSGFTLKIIDFDLAQRTNEKKITSAGTPGYRAPEVIDGSCAHFTAADIYSLGVILYAMKSQSAPFAEVSTESSGETRTSLSHYSTFIRNNEAFWKSKSGPFRDPTFFSKDFKDLINGILQFDITERFTLNDVKNSNWFKGPILSKEELRAEMRARWQLLKRKCVNLVNYLL